MCHPCTNKPAKGTYSTKGWYTPICPYTCGVGVPNVGSNPNCLDGIEYALSFFGGWKGFLAIALAIFITALLLLWRRRKSEVLGRPLLDDVRSSRSSIRQEGSQAPVKCFSRVCGPRRERADAKKYEIPRENLPFHVCRVYLQGENTSEAPWWLTPSVPPSLQEFVLEQRWHQLSQALNKAAEVGKMSARVEAVLKRLFPPLAPLFARCQRHCRAQAIIDVLNTESLSVGTDRLWKWMREPGNDFLLRFGCDRKASLAHLDFLDFAKSRLDWAPVNLLKEAWLIPVHGQGTFVEPFEVDISDPVLQLLEHTDFGPTAVLSVISTFNRAARIISKEDLYKDEDNSLQQLHEKVEQCASQCGLAGCVQACVISTSRRGPTTSTDRSVQSPATVDHADGVQSQNSFMDLVEQGQTDAHLSVRSTRRTKRSELRLCLVFTQFSTLASLADSLSDEGSKVQALTTPMKLQAFNDLLRCSATNIGEDASLTIVDPSCNNQSLQRMLLKWSKGSEGATARTLVSLTCLLAFDLMVFSLIFWILFKTSTAAGTVWILLPPLAQPLGLVFGLLFLILEDPDLGRLFADLELFSMWNAVFALLVLLFSLLMDSFLFDIVAMGVALCVKAMLFASAAAHIAQLEAASDLSFIGAPQGDFVAGFFAPQASRSQASSHPDGESREKPRENDASLHLSTFDAIGPRQLSSATASSFPTLTRCSSRSAPSPPASSSRIAVQAPAPASPF